MMGTNARSKASQFAMAMMEAGAEPEDAARLAKDEGIVAALAKEGADPVAIAHAVASNQPIPEPVHPAAYFDAIREAAVRPENRASTAAERLRIRPTP